MKKEVSLFGGGTWRADERRKRRGIVDRMEKLGRRRNPEVRGGFSHHFSTSNIQQPHQRKPEPTRPEQGESQTTFSVLRKKQSKFYDLKSATLDLRLKKCHLGFALLGLSLVMLLYV